MLCAAQGVGFWRPLETPNRKPIHDPTLPPHCRNLQLLSQPSKQAGAMDKVGLAAGRGCTLPFRDLCRTVERFEWRLAPQGRWAGVESAVHSARDLPWAPQSVAAGGCGAGMRGSSCRHWQGREEPPDGAAAGPEPRWLHSCRRLSRCGWPALLPFFPPAAALGMAGKRLGPHALSAIPGSHTQGGGSQVSCIPHAFPPFCSRPCLIAPCIG